MTSSKIVVCGAGFLGKYYHPTACLGSYGCTSGRHIVKTILNTNSSQKLETLKHRKVQLSSRNPKKLWDEFNRDGPNADLLPPVSVDITQPSTLREAFHGADWVVSLVGVMHGTPSDFNKIQWHGAENVAIEAKKAGARLIHFSAIGADPTSDIPYVRTKGLAEEAIFGVMPNAVVIRPSLVFGPEDDFFNVCSLHCPHSYLLHLPQRFAKLSKFLPFLPVFGDGATRFQPVFVDDLARAVEAISRNDPSILKDVEGRIIEAGGPESTSSKTLS